MKITIRNKNGNVDIKESKKCTEVDVINAYAIALGMKCGTMFKTKKIALEILDMAYNHSKSILDNMYE